MMMSFSDNIKPACQFLYPSTVFVGTNGMSIQTILGSCVAVCLYDPILKCGGMNHYMLPLWNGEGLESPKYGNVAIDMLLAKMTHLSSRKETLIAKVFGGANQYDRKSNAFNIGERNIQLALYTLKKYGIAVAASSLGGAHGRKVLFDTASGQVFMKYIHQENFEQTSIVINKE
jgi:chemotaxis protein CheD